MSNHEPSATRSVTFEPDAGTGWYGLSLPDPHRVLSILLRRWKSAAVVGGAVFVIIMVTVSGQKQVFVATASVLANPRVQQDVTTPPTSTPAQTVVDSNAVDTDVQILTSRSLAAEVVEELNLENDPEYFPPPTPRSPFAAFLHQLKSLLVKPPAFSSAQETVIANLLKHVTVRRAGLTYVININTKSNNAGKAAIIANAFAKDFIASQMKVRSSEARDVNLAINPRLQALANDVQEADAAVQRFKNDNDLLSANGATMAEQEASSLNEQIAAAKAEYAEKTALLNAARDQVRRGGGGADVAAAISSDTIRQLRAQQADTSRELAQLTTQFGDQYPDVVKARSQLHDIDRQIQLEINRIMSSLAADVQVAAQRVASLEGSLNKAHGSLASNNAAQVGLLELQRRADASHAIYDAYLSASKTTSAQEGVLQPGARIVSLAQANGVAAWPNLQIVIVIALAAAVAAALTTIGVLEMFNDGLETEADVQSRLRLPSAGTIPTLVSTVARGRGAKSPQTYIPDHPFSAFAEAFRSLKTFIMLPGGGVAPPQVIVITSALPHEGKSTTALCLAQTFQLSGTRVLLVDCDLRRRGVSQLVNSTGPGLMDVMQGKAALRDVVIKDPKSAAWVLPAGTTRSANPDVFNSGSVEQLIESVRGHFDVILLDTAPVLAIADTRLLASKADTTLMVTRWRKTPLPAVEQASQLLRDAGARLTGVALARVNLRQQVRSGYGDRDYYFNSVKPYYSE
jgi:capsular exopolysaccharide synthesis family protein